MDSIPDAKLAEWLDKIMAGKSVEQEMIAAGALPGPDTPLPPTNAALHILDHEVGYGTPDREFVALCGVRWKARGSTGEHKYFFQADPSQWHQHVNCPRCRELFGLDDDG